MLPFSIPSTLMKRAAGFVLSLTGKGGFLVKKIRIKYGVVIRLMKYGRCRTTQWRHDPRPICGDGAALGCFCIFEMQKLHCGIMVIADLDALLMKGEQHSSVYFHQHAVFPERPIGRGVQTHCLSDSWHDIISMGITKVSAADFCPHIPTVERSSSIFYTPNFERHI